MKYYQVSVDFVNMVFTAFSYLALAGAAWIFLRLFQACFCLPRHLKQQNNIQDMLQEKVNSYEKYLAECEEKEKADESGETLETAEKAPEARKDTRSKEEIWKERHECLDMLKRELKRVQDGGDIYDWDYLLEDDDKPEDEKKTEVNEAEGTKKEDLLLNEMDSDIVENPTKQDKPSEEKKEK